MITRSIFIILIVLCEFESGFSGVRLKGIDFQVHSILPVGPYQLNIKNMYSCNSTANYKITWNINAFIKNPNELSVIKGNTTLKIPLDDSLYIEMNIAMKDLAASGWKENVFTHKIPYACSSLKHMLGNQWNKIMNGLGISNPVCPIPPGIYKGLGFNASDLMKTNIPKTFVYGTYKIQLLYTRKNDIISCNFLIIEINRS